MKFNSNNSVEGGGTAPIQDLVGGKEKVEQIKSKVENPNGENEPSIVLRSSEVEKEAYPKEPEIVTNNKASYGD